MTKLKTNIELVKYARSKIGVPYVYGMKMQVMTKSMYDTLKSMYGSMVWNSDVNKVGKVCCDCSGLISSFTGIVRNSANYYSTAIKREPISTIDKAPIGALVWMQGHIGVYSGKKADGKHYYIAEDGSAYGCREVTLNNNKWTHWLICPDIKYIDEGELSMTQYEELNNKLNELNSKLDLAIYTAAKVTYKYNKIDEVPEWGKPTIQKLLDKKTDVPVFADKNNLDLNYNDLRVWVQLDRLGLLD